MKRCSRWIKLSMLICAIVTIIAAPLSTLAYIAATSNSLHNSFRVVYQPAEDISVPVVIQKNMVNLSEQEIGPGGFEFHLVDAETGDVRAARSDDSGRAEILLFFTAEDAGRTYNYRLYELNTGRENVTFDDTVYGISISLALNEDHELTAELTLNGEPVAEIVADFVNRYSVPLSPPDTGDHFHLALWAAMLMLSGAGLIVLVKKSNA